MCNFHYFESLCAMRLWHFYSQRQNLCKTCNFYWITCRFADSRIRSQDTDSDTATDTETQRADWKTTCRPKEQRETKRESQSREIRQSKRDAKSFVWLFFSWLSLSSWWKNACCIINTSAGPGESWQTTRVAAICKLCLPLLSLSRSLYC